ncbi:MAG: hypothetical protein KDK39_05530 [Leptospiraceae bacterium]|nr:hypothetical protein [Leptospiraceae bacterium]
MNPQSIELIKHKRHLVAAVITGALPISVMIGLALAIQHWGPLVPAAFFGAVGFLNWYLMERRPGPDWIKVDSQGIHYSWQRTHRSLNWNDVLTIQSTRFTLRGYQRLEIQTTGQMIPVHAHFYKLTQMDGQPVAGRLTDWFHPGWEIWDRPLKAFIAILTAQGKLDAAQTK